MLLACLEGPIYPHEEYQRCLKKQLILLVGKGKQVCFAKGQVSQSKLVYSLFFKKGTCFKIVLER